MPVRACFALLLALGANVAASAADKPPDTTAPSRAAIVASFETIVAASEAGDVGGYLAGITDDAVMMYSGQPALVGKPAVESFIVDFFEQYEFKFDPWQTDEVIVLGDQAFHRYSGIATVRPKGGGEPLILDRKYIDILRREDGAWKISHHIYNTNR